MEMQSTRRRQYWGYRSTGTREIPSLLIEAALSAYGEVELFSRRYRELKHNKLILIEGCVLFVNDTPPDERRFGDTFDNNRKFFFRKISFELANLQIREDTVYKTLERRRLRQVLANLRARTQQPRNAELLAEIPPSREPHPENIDLMNEINSLRRAFASNDAEPLAGPSAAGVAGVPAASPSSTSNAGKGKQLRRKASSTGQRSRSAAPPRSRSPSVEVIDEVPCAQPDKTPQTGKRGRSKASHAFHAVADAVRPAARAVAASISSLAPGPRVTRSRTRAAAAEAAAAAASAPTASTSGSATGGPSNPLDCQASPTLAALPSAPGPIRTPLAERRSAARKKTTADAASTVAKEK